MKDFLNTSILSLCFIVNTYACDICNSSATNVSDAYLGSNRNYIAILYHYLDFEYNETIANDSPLGNDYINPIRLVGNYNIAKKINVRVTMPYIITNRETSAGEVIHKKGIGDIFLSSTYNVLHHSKKHVLNIGAGVKLPTGDFSLPEPNNPNKTSSNQLGTGSWDVFFPLQYTQYIKDFTVRLQGTYFVKGTNKEEFKFGNQLSLQTNVSYPVINKKNKLLLSLGMLYDVFEETERFEIVDKGTDGSLFVSQLDIQYQLKDFIFGGNYRLPVSQKLIDNDVRFNEGFGVYTYYQF